MKDPCQWPMAARDYGNTRYSELDQINTLNVSRLQIAWTFSIGADRGQFYDVTHARALRCIDKCICHFHLIRH